MTARKNCTTERQGGREGERDRQTDRQTDRQRQKDTDCETQRENCTPGGLSLEISLFWILKNKNKKNFHWPVMIGNIYETIQSIILRLPPTGD